MHAETKRTRLEVLLINGTLILAVGLILLYLPGVMTNVIFNVFAVVNTLVLAGAAFLVTGVIDIGAALGTGLGRPKYLVFYSLIGIAFVISGIYLLYGPPEAIRFLVLFTIIHGLLFGTLGFFAAQRRFLSGLERTVLYAFASASVAMSGLIGGLLDTLDDRSSIGWTGGYLCLVGIKLLCLAGISMRSSTIPSELELKKGIRRRIAALIGLEWN